MVSLSFLPTRLFIFPNQGKQVKVIYFVLNTVLNSIDCMNPTESKHQNECIKYK